MTQNSGGLWPLDPDAVNGKRTVDDLEIPDDDLLADDDPGYTIDPDDELAAEASEFDGEDTDDLLADDSGAAETVTDEWGDDADNRLVDLDDDDDIDDLDR
ncbi:MAG: hypothetical protein ABWY68_00435 [Cryobacterium sp.]